MPQICLSLDEYEDHVDSYDGICLSCRNWTAGGVEPDAEKYRCEICEEHKVYGAEQALLLNKIIITEDDEDAD